MLTAHSEDSQAVVFEAIGSSLDELHLSIEALSDAVGSAEAPQSDDGFEPACFEGIDQAEELRDELTCLTGTEVFLSHESVGLLHLVVDGFESGLLGEEVFE